MSSSFLCFFLFLRTDLRQFPLHGLRIKRIPCSSTTKLQGTKNLRGTTLLPMSRLRDPALIRLTSATRPSLHTVPKDASTAPFSESFRTGFCRTAPVGISKVYLNLRKLSAGGLLSLPENKPLLYTINAFNCPYSSYFLNKCQELFFFIRFSNTEPMTSTNINAVTPQAIFP